MTHACAIVERATETCVVCPEVPFIAAVPTRTITDRLLGWNASAYSATRRTGDCYTQFQLPDVLGTVVGLAPARASSNPHDVPCGFYAFRKSGARWWQVVERGVPETSPVLRDADLGDRFRIERRGTEVRYFHDDQLVHVSTQSLPGSLVVVACLYAADDGVY